MNIETVYNSMMKQAFLPYGAGAEANDQYDKLKRRALTAFHGSSNYDKGRVDAGKLRLSDWHARDNIRSEHGDWLLSQGKDRLNDYINQALPVTLLAGGGAGLVGGGLTYAGLGLIPAMRKKKLLRAIAALTAGLGVGAVAGDAMGRYDLKQRVENEGPHSYFNSPAAVQEAIDIG